MSQSTETPVPAFYNRPGVETETLPIGPGIPIGFESVYNPELGIGGVYGSWGDSYDNSSLPTLVEQRLGKSLGSDEILNLAELGFNHRHHTLDMKDELHLDLELEVGSRLLQRAVRACGWHPSEVEGVLI